MKQALILATAILSLATIANAQQATEQQKNEFIAACLAGAIKTGCPPKNTQTSDVSEPTVFFKEIQAENAEARAQADREAIKTRAALQSPPPLIPVVHNNLSIPSQPAPEIAPAPIQPITNTNYAEQQKRAFQSGQQMGAGVGTAIANVISASRNRSRNHEKLKAERDETKAANHLEARLKQMDIEREEAARDKDYCTKHADSYICKK
ncbi:MAG: hypothetical protein WA766_04920 [Candidatus Acidiferrales bacterium]|jgi:hypothetical protein